MSGLVIDDGIKESDYGYVLRVSGPRECSLLCDLCVSRASLVASRWEATQGSLLLCSRQWGQFFRSVDDLLQTCRA